MVNILFYWSLLSNYSMKLLSWFILIFKNPYTII